MCTGTHTHTCKCSRAHAHARARTRAHPRTSAHICAFARAIAVGTLLGSSFPRSCCAVRSTEPSGLACPIFERPRTWHGSYGTFLPIRNRSLQAYSPARPANVTAELCSKNYNPHRSNTTTIDQPTHNAEQIKQSGHCVARKLLNKQQNMLG